MQDSTARAVAYIAGRLTTGRPASSVLDHRSAHRAAFSGDVTAQRVFVHDTDEDVLVTGQAGTDATWWLLHQGTMRFLTLQLAHPGSWTGFDYASHRAFDLDADTGGTVRLRDRTDGVWRTYQL